MSMAVQSETPPLHLDESGGYRIGNSRVLLETVIEEFEDGASPESIVQNFSTLKLDEVYAVIAYYLRHRDDVLGYLRGREAQAVQTRKKVESNQRDLTDIRRRLLKEKSSRGHS